MYRKGVSALILNKNKEVLLVNLMSFEDKYFGVPGGGTSQFSWKQFEIKLFEGYEMLRYRELA